MSDLIKQSQSYILEITQAIFKDNINNTHSIPFNLDEFQQKLIDSKSKFTRILAPAGSGKTKTLVAKAIDILQNEQDSNVLTLTFTNAAANEFKHRAKELKPKIIERLKVSTINSFGYELILSLKNHLKIVSPTDKTAGLIFNIVKQQMGKSPIWNYKTNHTLYQPIVELSNFTKSLGFIHINGLSEPKTNYQILANLGMDNLLRVYIDRANISGNLKKVFLNNWIPFWQNFIEICWQKNIITLEDQKYWALIQLMIHQKLRTSIIDRGYTHIMVDEFQDINFLDLYFLLQILSITKSSLIIVGDDDQCIYEWRGCTSSIIINPDCFFSKILENQKFESIIFNKNYRCPKNIVKYSKKLIEKNLEREKKEILAVNEENANIKLIPLPAAYYTINVVTELINKLSLNHPKHTVAIVGRKKSQLIPFQILMVKKSIRFSIDNDLNIFAGDAFKTIHNFLTLRIDYNKDKPLSQITTDFIHLLNKTTSRPFGENDKNEIINWIRTINPKTLSDIVWNFLHYPKEIKRGYVSPTDISVNLQNLLNCETVVSFFQTAAQVLKGFNKDLAKSKDDIFYAEPPFSHLADLAVNYGSNFIQFLKDLDKSLAYLEIQDSNESKIELLTALRTKGREFNTVIMLDTNDGIWPNKLAINANRDEEERRLFYVAMTRARNNLLFFESGRINGNFLKISPYFNEMRLPRTLKMQFSDIDKVSMELFQQLKI